MISGIVASQASVSVGAVYLDGLAVQPRAVLSLRKLISTATSAIRVRRSSDNAEQDIGFTGNGLDTASLSTFVGVGSGYVTKFYDQSGNGEDLSQATASKQPRLVNAGVYDGEAVFDGVAHAMAIASLAMGTAQVGIYMKARQPAASGVEIILEMSANYNVNSNSFVVYSDNASGQPLWVAARNSTAGSDYRLAKFGGITSAGIMRQVTILFDRSLSGTAEIAAWQGGTSDTHVVNGSASELTGVFSPYDLHVGARAGSSLYRDMSIETLVIYNGDTASIRSDIESVVA